MIQLDNVSAGYATAQGHVQAVAGISLEIGDQEILGIAGESGCGKSSLLKLLYGQIGGTFTISGGEISWTMGEGGAAIGPNGVRDVWWDKITYVPQVVNILNSVMRIEHQILDSVPKRLRKKDKAALLRDITEFFGHLDLPASVFRAYPHQLSGGMTQRVLIGSAAYPRPDVILADEPTTALDVVTQKKILLLLRRIQREQRNTLVIVTHDLGVHFQVTDRIAVLYAGKVVEVGPTRDVFANPWHPYTKALIESLPRIDDTKLRTGLKGRPPSLSDPPQGCRFADRCERATDICRTVDPETTHRASRSVACHFALGS